MRKTLLFALGVSLLSACTSQAPVEYPNDAVLQPRQVTAVGQKPRVVVLTDAETDDRCSMVHFLLYTNDMDVEAIVQSNSCFQKKGWSSEPWLEEQLSAYEQCYPNLKVHDPNYPTPEFLRSKVFVGDEDPEHVGEGWGAPGLFPGSEITIDPTGWEDTPGSDAIVKALLADDPRPLYIQCWGGGNTALRAFEKLKAEYPDKYEEAVKKAIMYCIWYQDGAGNYIERHHPGVTLLLNHHFSGSWDYGTMINSDNFVSQYLRNGQNPLGAFYTQPYISEGDSPSFLYSIQNGLRSYEDPTYGGWGGRFYKVEGFDNVYRDTGFGELREWMETAMHEFQARLKWCITPEYDKANHNPKISFPEGQDRTVHAGDSITLEIAVEDNDTPDFEGIWKLYQQTWEQHGWTFEYMTEHAEEPQFKMQLTGTSINWVQYPAGTYQGKVDLFFRGNSVTFVAPKVSKPETIHIITEVTDKGTPRLTSYARFIITVLP